MTTLLTSPIYTGCATIHRRWKPGDKVVRDAIYRLPLIQFTMGPRPEEAAALPKDAVLLRNNIYCIRFERRPDASNKNEASERFVPIPEILLRLGFISWWKDQLRKPGDLLFPELPPSAQDNTVSDILGKRRGRIFGHLGIRDEREDFYAGRMTVSTALLATGAPDFIRQAILGHEQNQIINKHYTQANLGLLKKHLDRIDLGLEIVTGQAGFPVITGCTLVQQKAIEVTLNLDKAQRPSRLEVRHPETDACTIIESRLSAKTSAEADFIDMERMGIALADAIADRAFRIAGDVDLAVERKLEMLLAIGTMDRSAVSLEASCTAQPSAGR